MNASPHNFVDPRRPIDRWLGNYAEDHRNGLNQIIHWICVPVIVWTVIAALWVIPVPAGIAKPGLWAGLALVGAMAFYLRLSRVLAFAMLIAFAALMALTWWLYDALGATALLWTAIGVFVAAWVGQFIGHIFEGKRPSFLTDLAYLLIGPLWLMSKLLRHLGLRW